MNAKSMVKRFCAMCFIAAIMVACSVSLAETVTFDETGYVLGQLPPSPWLDEYDATTRWAVAGGGVDGSQCLMVDYSRYVAYDLVTPLTSSMGARSITILFDPGKPVSDSTANYVTYGGLQVGNGSQKYGTGELLGVIFQKVGPGNYGIYGPGAGWGTYMGAFTPNANANYYQITFEINESWDTMTVSAGPVGGASVSMTAAWSGGDITRVWPVSGDSRFMTTGAFYDNLDVPSAQIPGDANGDGNVNIQDFVILKQNYGVSAGAQLSQGDFNGDGKVDIQDFVILKQNYGR